MYMNGFSQTITLLPSTTIAAAGTNTGNTHQIDAPVAAAFLLSVTAAATDANDTLNVYVQRSIDGGTTWRDIVSFTQVLGNGGAKTYEAVWTLQGVTPDNEEGAANDGALAAGNVDQGVMFGPLVRVKYVTVDPTGTNVSFTFSVKAMFQGAGSGLL